MRYHNHVHAQWLRRHSVHAIVSTTYLGRSLTFHTFLPPPPSLFPPFPAGAINGALTTAAVARVADMTPSQVSSAASTAIALFGGASVHGASTIRGFFPVGARGAVAAIARAPDLTSAQRAGALAVARIANVAHAGEFSLFGIVTVVHVTVCPCDCEQRF